MNVAGMPARLRCASVASFTTGRNVHASSSAGCLRRSCRGDGLRPAGPQLAARGGSAAAVEADAGASGRLEPTAAAFVRRASARRRERWLKVGVKVALGSHMSCCSRVLHARAG